jgi:ferredoxin-NADP reductase
LKNKRNLTSDVFLLEFETKESLDFIAWQFITFLLPKTGFRRAYSVLQKQKNIWRFIVKRLENGRWGSIELCDLELWSEIPWVGPVWHFVLSEKNNNKLFIATGTGMVPIYSMIEKLSLDSYSQKIWLLYGNRSQSENYFTQEFWDLWKNIPNFEFLSCLSWENIIWFTHGRVTTLLTLEMIQKYDEFYICWSPAMVDDVKNILEQNNVKKENIFFEKY